MLKNIKQRISTNLHLIFIIFFALILSFSLIYINSTNNILGHSYRDAYLYLIQALKWSGYSITGYDYVNYLSPLIPFLTAILFKLGFVSETSLFLTSGIFYCIGIIGLYFLLNLRFNKTISTFGAILYGSLSINLMWAGNGTLDIPSIALSILALYFFILAISKNQKYFYISIPLSILSFLGKYPGALILAVMILYFVSKNNLFGNIKKYIKNIIGGILLSLIFIIPFLGYYYINKIPLGFLIQANEISNEATRIATHTGASKSSNLIFYYFTNMPRFIYSPQVIIGYIILIIGIIGIIYGIYIIIKHIKSSYNSNPNKIAISHIPKIKLNKIFIYFVLILTLLIMIINFLNVANVSFIISEAIFFISIFIFSICINSIFSENLEKYPQFSYDLAMIGWFVGYMIFFSAHLTKAGRYFTLFAPSFVFFVCFGLNVIIKKISKTELDPKLKNESEIDSKLNRIKLDLKLDLNKIIPIIFIIFLLITTIGYLTIDKHDSLVDDEKNTSEWIKSNIPNYQNENIWADRGPVYSWYLKNEIKYHTQDEDGIKTGKFLSEKNASYYISNNANKTVNGFIPIKTIGEVSVYKRN